MLSDGRNGGIHLLFGLKGETFHETHEITSFI